METGNAPVPPAIADFETYRTWCDTVTNNFRRIGVLDAAMYDAAVQDEQTLFCENDRGMFPLAVPLRYEARYSAERSRGLTDASEVYLLAAPMKAVMNGEVVIPEQTAAMRDGAIIVEEFETTGDVAEVATDRQQLARALGSIGTFGVHDFEHPGLAERAGHETAWMGVYSFDVIPDGSHEAETTTIRPASEVMLDAWQEYRQERGIPITPGPDFDGTFLFNGEQLTARADVVDELWRISQKGFGEVLGAYHPISMEVTREFFDAQMSNQEMLTSVRFVNGKPVCFGSMALSMKWNDWLDSESEVLKTDAKKAESAGKVQAHFFDIISDGEKGVAYSSSINQLFYALAAKTGQQYHTIFESTNLSSLYIPRMVETQARRAAGVALDAPVRELGRLNYWYLAQQSDPVVVQ